MNREKVMITTLHGLIAVALIVASLAFGATSANADTKVAPAAPISPANISWE